MHLNAIALAAEEWGRVVETLVGSVSWRPFRHVTGTETEIFGHPPVTADRNERGSRSGSEFRSLVLQSRNGIVTAETAARPPTLPMETLSCRSWRTCTHTRAYEMTTRNVISSSRGDEEWRRIFIDRSIFLDASPALCFSALCIGACNRRWIAQLLACAHRLWRIPFTWPSRESKWHESDPSAYFIHLRILHDRDFSISKLLNFKIVSRRISNLYRKIF